MLIYNSQKEFIGIDENDLKILGFANLAQLRAESADFADLFVKTPGYIHNFKHVHWIDFVTCADSAEVPKIIIHANAKNYRCNINISTMFLSDNPTQKAYLINLQNLRELTKIESSNIANDIQERPTPLAAQESSAPFNEQAVSAVIPSHTKEIDFEETFETVEDKFEQTYVETSPNIIQDQYDDEPLDINLEDDVLEIEDEFRLEIKEEPEEETFHKEEYVESPLAPLVESTQENEEEFDKDYIFDPHLASNELGLPLDLIEEFIEDFVAQAKEFKSGLYDSNEESDFNNVKILSHKLKGVAANLRIEDAFEVLTVINTSADTDVIHKNLNYFYKIIAKLSGEVIPTPSVPTKEIATQETTEEALVIQTDDTVDDDCVLDSKEEQETPILLTPNEEDEEDDLFMDHDIKIQDDEVPQKIDIPELADDDFLNEEQELDIIDEEELSKELAELNDIPDLLDIDNEPLQETEEDTKEIIETKEDTKEIIETEEDAKEIIETDEEIVFNYDKQNVANEIGLDAESFNELFSDYVDESKSLSAAITDAINQDNSKGWKYAALKLKGMSDNMRIHDFTSELEALLSTSNQDEALNASKKITSVISKILTIEA